MRGTFRQLEVFMAVAENNSFSAGSDRLEISQAAVSKQIAALEKALGEPLFIRRSGYPAALTPRGQKLMNDLPAMMQHVSRVATPENQTKIVKIAAANMMLDRYFYPQMAEFAVRHPEIILQFEEIASEEEAIAESAKSNFDLIFYTFSSPLPASRGTLIKSVYSALFVAANRFSNLQHDLAGGAPMPVIMPLEGTADEAAHQRVLRSIGVEQFEVVARAQRVTMRLDIAARGMGVCLAPFNFANLLVQAGRLTQIEDTSTEAYRYCFPISRNGGKHIKDATEYFVSLLS